MEKRVPTEAEVAGYLTDRRNWGRWGKDDAAGTVNLITPEKRVAAAGLVKSGRTVSLSRPLDKTMGAHNPRPVQHYMTRSPIEGAPVGAAGDYFGIYHHGMTMTHLDALCHIWYKGELYNGRDPEREIEFTGAAFGSVDVWADGIVTRGVLIDIPRLRGGAFVTRETPIHGWEIEEAAEAEGVELQPGDAVVLYAGREQWQAANLDTPYGIHPAPWPGAHASCLPVLRDRDVALLVWDMLDHNPSGYELPMPVHGAIPTLGLPLLDNALLEPLADACAEEGRYEFMLTVAPLNMPGGTGSAVNPIALF